MNTQRETPTLIYVTAANRAAALAIGETLVAERLAACVNVLDGMTSVYRWQGAVETAQEAVLLIKTAASCFDAVAARVRELHSYDTPCVLEIPLGRGDPAYVGWLLASLNGGATPDGDAT